MSAPRLLLILTENDTLVDPDGRLVVQPTVSWHREEYDALGVPCAERGRILDEQLAAMAALWSRTPASHSGHRFAFRDAYCVPKPRRR